MPYYDFRCQDCEEDFELQRPVARRDEAQCPKCGSERVRRTLPLVYAVMKSGSAPSVEACGPGCCCMDGAEGACACAAERSLASAGRWR